MSGARMAETSINSGTLAVRVLRFRPTVTPAMYTLHAASIFTRESSYCFQRVLAIAILSVRLFVCLSHGWISQKR